MLEAGTAAEAVFRTALGFILVTSTAAKLRFPLRAIDAVRSYGVVPDRLVGLAGGSLIAMEGLAAAFLLSGAGRAPLYVAAAVFALFAGVAAWVLATRAEPVECGCLGGMSTMTLGWTSVLLNGSIAVLAVFAAAFGDGSRSVHPWDVSQGLVVLAPSASLLASIYWLALYATSVLRGLEERRKARAS